MCLRLSWGSIEATFIVSGQRADRGGPCDVGGELTPVIGQQEPPREADHPSGPRQDDPAGAVRQRISGKVERVKEGVQQWAASKRDPSAILKRMEEVVKPLFDAGKAIEAEAELDRVLEQLADEYMVLPRHKR